MTDFNIEIISLAGDHPRKKFQSAQMLHLGLKASFIDATTPYDLPKEVMAKLTSAWARPLRETEVALTHSHRTAWQRVLAAKRPALILEDDAVLCESLPQILSELALKTDLQFVQLETFKVPKLIDKNLKSLTARPYQIGRLYRDRGGAAAYFLWPDAAKKLVNSVQKNYAPADAAIHLAQNIRRHQVVPACAIQAMHIVSGSADFDRVVDIVPSTVTTTPKPSYGSFIKWLRYKSRRAVISFTLLQRKMVSRRLAEYRLVEFTGE